MVLLRFLPLPGLTVLLNSRALIGIRAGDAMFATMISEQLTDVSNKPGEAIFYNVYVNATDPENGLRIITEQTQQILQQWTSQHDARLVPMPPLYYNMIGLNYTKPFCPPTMSCTFLNHYEQAFEEVTLQSLYDYCRTHPQDQVYYLHNKGSFTKTHVNEMWRRNETDFLFSKNTTLLMANHNHTCNVVGREWEPFPWWHFHGNFWKAKCSYVRKLIPPKEFAQVRSQFIQRRLLPTDNKKPESPFYCLSSFFKWGNLTNLTQFPSTLRMILGLDRFAYEHWVSSHPDVVPCDHRDSAFTTHVLNFKTSRVKHVWGEGAKRYRHEWFRWNGRLFELYHLFGQLPPNTSFFWKYYRGTEQPMEPLLCQQGRGRNLSAYFVSHDTQWSNVVSVLAS